MHLWVSAGVAIAQDRGRSFADRVTGGRGRNPGTLSFASIG